MGNIERPTEDFILGVIKRDHRVGLALAAVPKVDLNPYNPLATAKIINEIQGQAIDMLGHGGAVLRHPAPESIEEFFNYLRNNSVRDPDGSVLGNRYIMLRHGGQRLDNETGDLKGASQKIRLMQWPHNMKDPLTDQSIAEAVGFGLVLACILQDLNIKDTQVRSSENMRAAEVAAIIARITGASAVYDKRLNCVNYPKPADKTDEEIDELLGPGEKGGLRWHKGTVDSVIGEGTFDKITEDVKALIGEGITGLKELVIDVTHTQQTNGADCFAGRKPTRLGELGFSYWSRSWDDGALPKSGLLPDGIFQP